MGNTSYGTSACGVHCGGSWKRDPGGTVNPLGHRQSRCGNPSPPVRAPALDPTGIQYHVDPAMHGLLDVAVTALLNDLQIFQLYTLCYTIGLLRKALQAAVYQHGRGEAG